MRVRPLFVATLLAAPLAANAATLKPFTTLPGAVVRLSDLWDGIEADKPLGPAPAPGGRITVPAAQLAAIARQFGVDWRPASSGDRAILERAGRTLTRDDVKSPILDALAGAGAPTDVEVEIGAFAAPPFPADARPSVAVQSVDWDKLSGRFSALLGVTADGMPALQLRVAGRTQEMVELPVVRRRMLPGEVIAPADLEWARIRGPLARTDVVRLPREAVGQAVKHSLAPNLPIAAADLGRPVLVDKGEKLVLTLETPGLALTAQGVATQPGGLGEHIRVLNTFSRVTLEAEVTAPGRARVVPGTTRPTASLAAVQ